MTFWKWDFYWSKGCRSCAGWTKEKSFYIYGMNECQLMIKFKRVCNSFYLKKRNLKGTFLSALISFNFQLMSLNLNPNNPSNDPQLKIKFSSILNSKFFSTFPPGNWSKLSSEIILLFVFHCTHSVAIKLKLKIVPAGTWMCTYRHSHVHFSHSHSSAVSHHSLHNFHASNCFSSYFPRDNDVKKHQQRKIKLRVEKSPFQVPSFLTILRIQ